jgi:predicted nucleotidyltransferase
MEKLLSQLVEKLQKAYGDRLISVVLHGSAAWGGRQPKFSDINVLCVFSSLAVRDLAAGEEIVRWWRRHADSALMPITQSEVSDCSAYFALEFIDIQRSHRLLYGKDVVSGLAVDRRFYRAQVERDLCAKLLRLRQKAAGMMSHPDLLLRLLVDSASTFCVLFRHALEVRGIEAPPARRETIALAREHFRIDTAVFEKLLDVREGRVSPRQTDAVTLLGPYMECIRAVADQLTDRLAGRVEG